MATFPRREADIAVLAERMISGFNAHGEVFPHADPAALEAVREALAEANDAQGQARAAAPMPRAPLASGSKSPRPTKRPAA
jgi:hypothetical protein